MEKVTHQQYLKCLEFTRNVQIEGESTAGDFFPEIPSREHSGEKLSVKATKVENSEKKWVKNILQCYAVCQAESHTQEIQLNWWWYFNRQIFYTTKQPFETPFTDIWREKQRLQKSLEKRRLMNDGEGRDRKHPVVVLCIFFITTCNQSKMFTILGVVLRNFIASKKEKGL